MKRIFILIRRQAVSILRRGPKHKTTQNQDEPLYLLVRTSMLWDQINLLFGKHLGNHLLVVTLTHDSCSRALGWVEEFTLN